MEESVLDRRGADRYSISARLRWESVGHRDSGKGLTRNISTRGVYFQGERRLAVGQPIRLTMTLERRSICLGGDGVVVRVEPREGGYGVGTWIEELLPLPDALCVERGEPGLPLRGGRWLRNLLKPSRRPTR